MADDMQGLEDPDLGTTNYKVRLVSVYEPSFTVVFSVTPSFAESRTVDYSPVTPVHMPGSIQVYKHTNSRTFSIGAHFVSRNINDASTNMRYLQMLRSWAMPFFGTGSSTLTQEQQQNRKRTQTQLNDLNRSGTAQSQNYATGGTAPPSTYEENRQTQIRSLRSKLQDAEFAGVEALGAPPEVLYLYAYSSISRSVRVNSPFVNINQVPVVLTNLSITYPEDVDYIPTWFENEPFPVKMDVSIELAETHSPTEYAKFSLQQYKFGLLTNF